MQRLRRGIPLWAGPLLLVVEFLLAILLAVLLARIVWIVVDPGGAVSRVEPLGQYASPVLPVQAARTRAPDYGLLVSINPFDRAEGNAELAVPDAPETKLNLVLKGVRAMDDGGGAAMIRTPDNRTRIYRPGDTILEGVLLDRVFGDRVTLRKGGATEALLMRSAADRLSVLSSPENAGAVPEPFSSRAGNESPRQQPDSAASAFLMNLEINPVHRGQAFIGYEIGARGDAGLLVRAGLQPGDILLSVNGSSVNGIAPGDIVRQFSSGKPVRLRIERDGRVVEQNFSLPEKP